MLSLQELHRATEAALSVRRRRRGCTVVGPRATYGPYVVGSTSTTRDGPAPAPGQFYMLAAVERWGGGEASGPFLPRAFSVLRVRDGVGSRSCSTTSARARSG